MKNVEKISFFMKMEEQIGIIKKQVSHILNVSTTILSGEWFNLGEYSTHSDVTSREPVTNINENLHRRSWPKSSRFWKRT